jgi:hypothetical protein
MPITTNTGASVMIAVTIPLLEYNSLKADRRYLDALRACGVDNWDGYDAAVASLEDDDV